MKTLFQINTVVNSGSTGRIAEEIGQTAITNGWQSFIAYGRNERPSQSKLIKIGSNWDIKLHGLQTRFFDRHGLGSKSATQILIKQIENIKPDIIHLHNIHGYYLNIEVLFNFLAKTNIPVVWTLHDCWPLTGHCTHFEFVGCKKWLTQCYQCPQKKEYPASFFLDRSRLNYNLKRKLFNSVDNLTLVPVSDWLAHIIKQSFLSNHKIKVINNGINTSVFKPTDASALTIKYKLTNQFVILGVANVWSPPKGLGDFIKLSEILGPDFKIVLVGLNSTQLKQLPTNITGVSKTESAQELAQLYSLSDVYVNTSKEETFGMTTAEAFACGTPAIVFNATANPELITSETGIIVESANIKQLLGAIKEIKTKGKGYYVKACVQRVKRYYNKEERFQDYISLYDKILKEG